ncbi:MAG TPA: nuclear transport factor 2 family protein [Marmoricola sp.]|jgi:steroid delta-isomerase|nr:nuclear transport factor 2 family protein [Marmoricola sp.]
MPTREQIQTAIEDYIDAVGRHDLDATLAVFADDAVQEDPIGTPPNVGKDAIRAFFVQSYSAPFTTELTGPLLITGNYAAVHFTINVETGGDPFVVRAIDVMTFDEDCKVTEVRAIVD